MTIGIICAMEEEINLLNQDIQSESVTSVAGRDFYTGKLYGKDVVLAKSRIGKVAAGVTAALMIDRFGVDKIIFAGTAGGVDPELNVGDIAVADYNVQHDYSVPGGEPFRIPLIDISYIPSDEALTKTAFDAVSEYVKTMTNEIPSEFLEKFHIRTPKAVLGTIASGDQFICEKEKNQWLYEQVRNIKCVEMEGAAVAQVCYEWGVPFTVIRVISDSANDDAGIDFDLFIEKAARFFTRGIVRSCLEAME